MLEQFSVVLPRHLGFEINRAQTRCASEGRRYLVLRFTAGIASLPMNLPLLKSCVLGINWRTFTLSQPAANAANRVELFA